MSASHDSTIFIPVKVNNQQMLEKKMTHPFQESLSSNSQSLSTTSKPQELYPRPILYSQISDYQSQKKFLKIALSFLPPRTRQNGMVLLKSLSNERIIDFDAKDNLYKANQKIPKAKTSKLVLSLLHNPTSLVHGEEFVLKHLKNENLSQIKVFNPHKWNIAQKTYFRHTSTPLKKRLFNK